MSPGDPDSAAAEWFARLGNEAVSAHDRETFDQWIAADARHEAAWTRCQALWGRLGGLDADTAFAALRADALGAAATRGGMDRRAFGAIAAGAVLAVGAGGYLTWRSTLGATQRDRPADDGPTFTTAVGQQTAFRLEDGSMVTLGTDSAIRVNDWTGGVRRLSLLRGQAYFQVAKDKSRPFIVAASNMRVTAVGTAFDVRLDPNRLSVTLVEGRVRIAGPAPRGNGDQMVEMSAGSQFIAPSGADWRLVEVDAAREVSWLQGRLVFDGEPLSTVVEEMNRFSRRKLRLADGGLGAQPVSGVFKTGQVDAFVAALESYRLAKVGHADEQRIDLVRY
ncbi:MAG: FecR domain-containing protein [Caulobacteraceae bacterium]|nr:FecR domain-containing protein [Caulobacteraceae bacterium]